jgi:two-component system, OmpR family, phosphate regulon response regulator PhoB
MTAALIVDDEPAILRLVAMVLRELGFETLTAPDAETASQLLKSSKPDLVVTDVRLPGISGIELAKRIKSSKRLRKVPVLLMSAFAEPPAHAGDGFIAKPFDISELEETFNRYIDLSGTGSENGESGRGQRADG